MTSPPSYVVNDMSIIIFMEQVDFSISAGGRRGMMLTSRVSVPENTWNIHKLQIHPARAPKVSVHIRHDMTGFWITKRKRALIAE